MIHKNLCFLDIPASDILELFGKIFFEYCQDAGYDKIMQVLGATPRDFLQVQFFNNITSFTMMMMLIVKKNIKCIRCMS